ncbi:hypothetical protein HMPREF3227_01856 [Corynebacterium sp. CMW7794]|nr:hypothetical protein HMPREF0307_00796 [Corynebacterium sp. DNF00584]KXI16791.1 hypothetical protein HMPREF3227_01856 [Corynebacterium sp. CMW7794]
MNGVHSGLLCIQIGVSLPFTLTRHTSQNYLSRELNHCLPLE